jgi:hypothetical protein
VEVWGLLNSPPLFLSILPPPSLSFLFHFSLSVSLIYSLYYAEIGSIIMKVRKRRIFTRVVGITKGNVDAPGIGLLEGLIQLRELLHHAIPSLLVGQRANLIVDK